MEISAVNNLPNIIQRPKFDIASGNIEPTDKQQVQPQNQGSPENEKKVPISEEQIKNAIEQANKSLAACGTKLEFSIHDKTKEIMVKVVNANTGEVINEIPSKKSMDRLAMVMEEIGLLVDERV